MGALAARTEKLRLGTGIYLAALHHPVNVIEQVSQLDQVSGGRAILGVGVGYRPYEYEGYNVDFHSRGRRLTESLQVMKKRGQLVVMGSMESFSTFPTTLSTHRACKSRTH